VFLGFTKMNALVTRGQRACKQQHNKQDVRLNSRRSGYDGSKKTHVGPLRVTIWLSEHSLAILSCDWGAHYAGLKCF
jgi:hypothetical protein